MLQVCDHDLKILNINAQFAGATHDSYIWRRSQVRNELEACYQNGECIFTDKYEIYKIIFQLFL